jgi:hypothetical protein
MTTPLAHSERENRSLAPILTAMFLASRSVLPREANGRDPIPSNAIAASKRASIVSKKADPFHMLLAVSECDVRDGCMVDDVTAPYRQVVHHLECIARGFTRRDDRALLLRIRSETRAQHRADLAEIRVAANPEDERALFDAIRESNRHMAELVSFRDGCEEQLARVRVSKRTNRHQMALA